MLFTQNLGLTKRSALEELVLLQGLQFMRNPSSESASVVAGLSLEVRLSLERRGAEAWPEEELLSHASEMKSLWGWTGAR